MSTAEIPVNPLSTEDAYMKRTLRDIGSWRVGGAQHRRHLNICAQLLDSGLVQMRAHYSEKTPSGVPAFEVTELGLEVYEELWEKEFDSDKIAQREADILLADREWYRANTQVHNWREARAASIKAQDARKAAEYAK